MLTLASVIGRSTGCERAAPSSYTVVLMRCWRARILGGGVVEYDRLSRLLRAYSLFVLVWFLALYVVLGFEGLSTAHGCIAHRNQHMCVWINLQSSWSGSTLDPLGPICVLVVCV